MREKLRRLWFLLCAGLFAQVWLVSGLRGGTVALSAEGADPTQVSLFAIGLAALALYGTRPSKVLRGEIAAGPARKDPLTFFIGTTFLLSVAMGSAGLIFHQAIRMRDLVLLTTLTLAALFRLAGLSAKVGTGEEK